MPSKNRVINACAGAGKTGLIIEEALQKKEASILILTYTLENIEQIKERLYEKNGSIPENITIQSWYSFLLRDCIRPYQHSMVTISKPIQSVTFLQGNEAWLKHRRRFSKQDEKYYIDMGGQIYQDRASDFAYECNIKTQGNVIQRLASMYSSIFIDEAQDLSGWDYDLVGLMMDHDDISVTLVGDPRQNILQTNRSPKNRQYNSIFDWINKKSQAEVSSEEKSESRRCGEGVCNLASDIFPEYPQIHPATSYEESEMGVQHIAPTELKDYIERHNPQLLRRDKRTNTFGYPAMNIGVAKGRTFDRILIFPSQSMIGAISSNDFSVLKEREKLYVAVTRAKYSVAFCYENPSNSQ